MNNLTSEIREKIEKLVLEVDLKDKELSEIQKNISNLYSDYQKIKAEKEDAENKYQKAIELKTNEYAEVIKEIFTKPADEIKVELKESFKANKNRSIRIAIISSLVSIIVASSSILFNNYKSMQNQVRLISETQKIRDKLLSISLEPNPENINWISQINSLLNSPFNLLEGKQNEPLTEKEFTDFYVHHLLLTEFIYYNNIVQAFKLNDYIIEPLTIREIDKLVESQPIFKLNNRTFDLSGFKSKISERILINDKYYLKNKKNTEYSSYVYKNGEHKRLYK